MKRKEPTMLQTFLGGALILQRHGATGMQTKYAEVHLALPAGQAPTKTEMAALRRWGWYQSFHWCECPALGQTTTPANHPHDAACNSWARAVENGERDDD